jgi:hypothetical protein
LQRTNRERKERKKDFHCKYIVELELMVFISAV